MLWTDKMNKIVIYHTPFVIDQITRILYNSVKDLIAKVEYVKQDSDERLKKLFDM